MRLVELTIQNFRGFGKAAEAIRLDRDLILIFGPNGFGKTSIAEAIEWLFYGSTKRRLQGDGYSKAEYAGTYANAHHAKPVQVDLKVALGGSEFVLSRRLVDGSRGETTETFIDGVKSSFASIGAEGGEAVYPVVAQHGLQTFIHSKPKDRRDAIGAALGLDELITLKSSLESARSSFQRTPPPTVVQARRDLAANVGMLALIPDAAELVLRWQKTPMQVQPVGDIDALLRVTTVICGVSVATVEEALAALRIKRTEASRAVFDASKITPAVTSADDAAAFTETAAISKRSFDEFEDALAASIAALAATYSAALLGFWTTGLTLSLSGNMCPMCEADTLTATQRSELGRRIAEGGAAIASDQAFTQKFAALLVAIAAQKAAAAKCCVKGLTDGDRILLRTLLTDADAELTAFLAHCDQVMAAKESHNEVVRSAEDYLQSVQSRISDGAQAPHLLAEVAAAKSGVEQAAAALARAVAVYHQQWAAFETILNGRIATQGAVAKIDAVGKTLQLLPAMNLLAKYDAILAETQDVIRAVETTLQTKQGELLTTRGAEVKALYDLLNPGANVVFDCMEPGTDQIKLHASSFGVRMPAAANLSECQLNCLGLSVWIMQATTPGSPFDFIVLDDPVQAMDDDHAEAFLSAMVPHLLDKCGKQVIVLSHVQNITDRLRTTNMSRAHRYYHLDNYMQSGPVVTEQAKLAKMLAHIKASAQGNVANREHAVDRLRVLIEHFIRELHLKIVGTAAPTQYDNVTATELLKLFRTIPGTTPQEHSALADTVGFTDPAHHSQVGYSTPLPTAIQPHIDRVTNLLRKHGLLT
jgi:energy-coupling factor transporter ATP-binding protein EcfA2